MSPAPDTQAPEILALVEWEKGTTRRCRHENGQLVFYREDQGPAPCNYGCIPGTLNPADGAEIDVIWLDGPLPVGTLQQVQVSGLLWLADQDHKVLTGNLGNIQPVLDWFEPGREAKVLSRQQALDWLGGLKALL